METQLAACRNGRWTISDMPLLKDKREEREEETHQRRKNLRDIDNRERRREKRKSRETQDKLAISEGDSRQEKRRRSWYVVKAYKVKCNVFLFIIIC